MLILGCLGKFGALFSTIPGPVIGGMFMITFGMVTAVGLSNLQYVNMNTSRNIFIVGVSLYFGLSLPKWVAENDHIRTGNDIVDQILSVLFGTSMFVGGLVGFVLDNTIPGTDEERGIITWRQRALSDDDGSRGSRMEIYHLPLIQRYIDKVPFFRYIPFCTTFKLDDASHTTAHGIGNGDATRKTDYKGESNDGFDEIAEKEDFTTNTQL